MSDHSEYSTSVSSNGVGSIAGFGGGGGGEYIY
jgi:hypothetical protein